MSEPVSFVALWTVIKPLIPNIIGGLLALWKVDDEVKWADKTLQAKVFTVLMTPIIFIMATFFGYYFGGAILELAGAKISTYAEESILTYGFIMVLATASSLRFLRMFMVRIEEIFDLVFDGLVSTVKRIFKIDTKE